MKRKQHVQSFPIVLDKCLVSGTLDMNDISAGKRLSEQFAVNVFAEYFT